MEEDGKTKKSQKDDEEQIAKYKQLLQVIQEKEKKGKENDMEMEIKWVPGKNYILTMFIYFSSFQDIEGILDMKEKNNS